jgi:hypothetical protein
MKKIILDHFRRWWLALSALLVAYFAFQAVSVHLNNSQTSDEGVAATVNHTINAVPNIFIFQILMFLGFLLMFDLQRGLARALAVLPVTTKQIGRAWWLVSVALPAIALLILGLLAFLIFSSGTSKMISLENYLAGWVLATLYLGAMFGALTFITMTFPDTLIGRIRVTMPNLLFAFMIMELFVIQVETLTTTKRALIFSTYAILAVFGWFRAERMVLQRAGFRFVSKTSSKKSAQHKTSQGFGGLPYLAQRTFIQSTLIGLALMFFMTLVMSFVAHDQNRAQAVISMIQGGSTPYVFYILIFSIVPIVFQLRFLRTLPISSPALAATVIFLPLLSIAAVGVVVTTLVSFVAGEAVILPVANGFLMLGAKAAIIVSLVVWRGLGSPTYLLIFLLVLSDSFISLGMTIIFHLGSKTPERPWWVNLTIFLLCVIVSFALTRRLLTKSSSAYRVRTMPANTWPVWGGIMRR